jgi:hypothetical protein
MPTTVGRAASGVPSAHDTWEGPEGGRLSSVVMKEPLALNTFIISGQYENHIMYYEGRRVKPNALQGYLT